MYISFFASYATALHVAAFGHFFFKLAMWDKKDLVIQF